MITCDGKEIEVNKIPIMDTYFFKRKGINQIYSVIIRKNLMDGLRDGTILQEEADVVTIRLPYLQEYWGEK